MSTIGLVTAMLGSSSMKKEIKVDLGWWWFVLWWMGFLFTAGYTLGDLKFEGIGDALAAFALWPFILGEALK